MGLTEQLAGKVKVPYEAAMLQQALKDAETGRAQKEKGDALDIVLPEGANELDLHDGVSVAFLQQFLTRALARSKSRFGLTDNSRKLSNSHRRPIKQMEQNINPIPKQSLSTITLLQTPTPTSQTSQWVNHHLYPLVVRKW